MAVYTAASLLFLSLCTFANASCKNFTQSGESFTIPSPSTQIVSQGYVCNPPTSQYPQSRTGPRCNLTSSCPYTAYGTVNAVGITNLSIPTSDLIPLYDLVSQSTGGGAFFYSFTDTLGNATGCLDAQPKNSSAVTAGTYGFTATLRCVNGTFNGCEDGPVDDGGGVQICAVATYNLDDPGMSGSVGFIQRSDLDGVANLTTNPAANRKPNEILPKDMRKFVKKSDAGGLQVGVYVMSFGVVISSLVLLGLL